MPATDRDRFVRSLCSWINGRLLPAGPTVSPDTELFEGGLINSMRVLELIAWTERALGRRIPDRMIRMDLFKTVNCIADAFLEDKSWKP